MEIILTLWTGTRVTLGLVAESLPVVPLGEVKPTGWMKDQLTRSLRPVTCAAGP